MEHTSIIYKEKRCADVHSNSPLYEYENGGFEFELTSSISRSVFATSLPSLLHSALKLVDTRLLNFRISVHRIVATAPALRTIYERLFYNRERNYTQKGKRTVPNGGIDLGRGFDGLGGFSVTQDAEDHVVTDLEGVDVEESLLGGDEREVNDMSEWPELFANNKKKRGLVVSDLIFSRRMRSRGEIRNISTPSGHRFACM